MAKAKPAVRLRRGIIQISKIYLILALVYVTQIIVYDASKLITPDVVLDRWIAVTLFAAVATVIWYIGHAQAKADASYRWLAWGLTLTGIAFASYNVYAERGMASKAVLLYLIPIIVSAILCSRAAIFATAVLSTIAYALTAVAYFVNYFNEGYKVELYGEITFYSAVFFIAAGLLGVVLKLNKDST
jgi:hypothetical protein